MLRCLIITLLFTAMFCLAAENTLPQTCLIEERTLEVLTPIRVKTITEKAETIINPVRWQPIKTIIPDGSRVKAGDTIATFFSGQCETDLHSLLLKQAVIDANLARRLANIDNRNLDMADQMGVLEDKLASLISKLERQKSEPTQDDITIVEGRLRIARMNLDAARKDFTKDQDRFKREMISRAELDASEKNLLEKEARFLFAQQELEDTKHPPERDGELNITEINIQTTRLEIEKLAFEMQEQLKISEIQRKGARSNKERNTREIKEKREDLEHLAVKAPISGFVSVNQVNGNEIVLGTKMWPNFGFMHIPHLNTIAFKGVIPEVHRQYHDVGDNVIVFLNGRKDAPLNGTIKSISTLSHDLAEKDNTGSKQTLKVGVKVFDVLITLNGDPGSLRPGMFGTAVLKAAKKVTGPAIPLNFVREHDGKFHISIDGLYTEVNGHRIGSFFILDDHALLGRRAALTGEFREKQHANGQDDNRLSATGELLPMHSTDIIVGDIGRWPWPKITWLVPEESIVKKGDVVAKLDTNERDKQVREQETRVTSNKSNTDELEKKVEITRRNADFKLKVAQNRLETTRISTTRTLEIIPPIPVHRAEMNRKLAEIKLLDQKRKVQREKSKKIPTVSPSEFRRMKRELKRAELKLEQAEINLKKARQGATPIARSNARINLTEAEDNLATTRKQIVYDNLAIRREFERSKIQLARVTQRLERFREQVERHTITAPVDGLICYNKVYNYDTGEYTKVAVGNTVGRRFNILSIPDLSEMEMKVEVEEKYYSRIKKGMEVEVHLPSLNDSRLSGTVTGIDLLFVNKSRKDSQIGLYSSHEPLGEVLFYVRIAIKPGDVKLKPGLNGEVFFPIRK